MSRVTINAVALAASCDGEKFLGLIALARKAQMTLPDATQAIREAVRQGLVQTTGSGATEFYRRAK